MTIRSITLRSAAIAMAGTTLIASGVYNVLTSDDSPYSGYSSPLISVNAAGNYELNSDFPTESYFEYTQLIQPYAEALISNYPDLKMKYDPSPSLAPVNIKLNGIFHEFTNQSFRRRDSRNC